MEKLKVSKNSTPKKVAGAIAGLLREGKCAEIEAVGAAAVNQSIKSIAIARGYLAPMGVELICKPAFREIAIEGEKKTSIVIVVECR